MQHLFNACYLKYSKSTFNAKPLLGGQNWNYNNYLRNHNWNNTACVLVEPMGAGRGGALP